MVQISWIDIIIYFQYLTSCWSVFSFMLVRFEFVGFWKHKVWYGPNNGLLWGRPPRAVRISLMPGLPNCSFIPVPSKLFVLNPVSCVSDVPTNLLSLGYLLAQTCQPQRGYNRLPPALCGVVEHWAQACKNRMKWNSAHHCIASQLLLTGCR